MRDAGYYWVKTSMFNDWCAAWYSNTNNLWSYCGEIVDDTFFKEINETRILNPDERMVK